MRELENVINRACILAEDRCISLADLPAQITSQLDKGTQGAPSQHLRNQLRRLEQEIVRRAIDAAGGDRKLAAEQLGIGLSSLYRKIEDSQQ